MYQGFYNLASGMITQRRNLNVISNNMVNVQTAGYKHDTLVTSTFEEEMLYRTGRVSKGNPTPLAVTSKIKTISRTYVDYTQGSFEATDEVFDVALSGKGFFCIQTPDGVRYSRNGAFAVDRDGYLVLGDLGRVLGDGDQPIQIDNENFTISSDGTISVLEDGDRREFGTIKVVDFANYDQLHKEDNGLISTNQAQIEPRNEVSRERTSIVWQALEKSNTDMIEEMTNMMSSQRALQSAAQMLKMYDQIMSKSSSDVGKI